MTKEFDKKNSTLSTFPEEVEVESQTKMPKAKLYEDEDHVPESAKPSAFSAGWTGTLVKIRKPVSKAICWMSDTAAWYIASDGQEEEPNDSSFASADGCAQEGVNHCCRC